MKIPLSPISPSAASPELLAEQEEAAVAQSPSGGAEQLSLDGKFIVTKDGEPVGAQGLLDAFHTMYYGQAFKIPATADKRYQVYHRPVTDVKWLGTQCMKMPFDLMVLQEIIYDTRPDLIIECGTSGGGSALFMASICELLRHGCLVTIDIKKYYRPYHPVISWCETDTLNEELIETLRDSTKQCEKVMVVLDDDHEKEHVLKEMEIYSEFVRGGCYMIVEDTNINGHPVFEAFGPGPWEAVEEFMKTHGDEWEQDRSREHFGLTYHPGGYLRRKK